MESPIIFVKRWEFFVSDNDIAVLSKTFYPSFFFNYVKAWSLQSSVGVVSHPAVLVLSRNALLQQGKELRDETKTALKGTTIGAISAY